MAVGRVSSGAINDSEEPFLLSDVGPESETFVGSDVAPMEGVRPRVDQSPAALSSEKFGDAMTGGIGSTRNSLNMTQHRTVKAIPPFRSRRYGFSVFDCVLIGVAMSVAIAAIVSGLS